MMIPVDETHSSVWSCINIRGVARGGLRGLEHPPHLPVWAGFIYIASTVFILMVTIESISTQLTTHTILPLIK